MPGVNTHKLHCKCRASHVLDAQILCKPHIGLPGIQKVREEGMLSWLQLSRQAAVTAVTTGEKGMEAGPETPRPPDRADGPCTVMPQEPLLSCSAKADCSHRLWHWPSESPVKCKGASGKMSSWLAGHHPTESRVLGPQRIRFGIHGEKLPADQCNGCMKLWLK